MSELPPGQRALSSFPRFGVPFAFRPLRRPSPGLVKIRGALARELELPVARLGELPRTSIIADFHCVTGWSAEALRWSGVPFHVLYSEVIAPEAHPHAGVSHVLFRGADGYRSVLRLDDAFEPDVLLADALDGAPLGDDHGAPVRILSPRQYGYKSTKHLSAIELHTRDPADRYPQSVRRLLDEVLAPHPRARVWEEERHRVLPNWFVRPLYRALIPPVVWLWNERRR